MYFYLHAEAISTKLQEVFIKELYSQVFNHQENKQINMLLHVVEFSVLITLSLFILLKLIEYIHKIKSSNINYKLFSDKIGIF